MTVDEVAPFDNGRLILQRVQNGRRCFGIMCLAQRHVVKR